MIIAVNTRLLIHDRLEGIGRFTAETLKIITREHPEHQFVFIFDRKFSDEFVFSQNVRPVIAYPPARHPVLWYWFFEHALPRELNKCKADLFLSPDGWLSLKTGVKSLPVIHDLNFLHYPHFIPFTVRRYYAYFFPRFVSRASRIATVSEYTAHDISSTFGFPKDKIDVVYNGATGFMPVNREQKAHVQLQYAGGNPYYVSVGLIHPRKNLTNLFRAYERFRRMLHGNVKLLVVGARKWWTDDMQKAYDQCSYHNDIVFTGRVSDEELIKITASAIGLIYVSYFEGFGIPVLEAMNSDVPVICSSVSALPEVGGDAVLYTDPANPEAIAEAMLKLYKDESLRDELISKSRVQREKFSWEKSAHLLWQSIEKCTER
jgi:glycosyltransferase involved in cell wall biosynthesis